jgi:methyl-accepting chemotaxis protein
MINMSKLSKINNIKLGPEMIVILLIPVIALVTVSLVSLVNADRDYYQVLSTQQSMEVEKHEAKLKKLKDTYNENKQQTVERVHKAYDILSITNIRVANSCI